LNGLEISLNDWINILERSIHLLAVQKFQSERLIELCLIEADRASAFVLAPMEVKIRSATDAHAGDDDFELITGRGTEDNEAAVYGVCWCLLPITPLCYVNPGPAVCDSHRLTMALDVALNSFDSYSRPAVLKSRSGMKPGAFLAALIDLHLIEHSMYQQQEGVLQSPGSYLAEE